MRSRHLLLIFIPAFIVGAFGFLVQIIRYQPLIPKDIRQKTYDLNIPIYDDDPVLGNKRAPITIIAFEDLGCVPCRESMKVLNALIAEYPKKIKVIWKGLPITQFPTPSARAHAYAFCAHKEKKFSFFEQTFIENDASGEEESLREISQAIGLDEKNMTDCLASDVWSRYQEKTEALATSLNIQAVPALFIQNKQINPPHSVAAWAEFLNLSL